MYHKRVPQPLLCRLRQQSRDAACVYHETFSVGDQTAEALVKRGWQLVERLVAAGHKGIVVRSFAPGSSDADLNLVLWSWGDEPPYRVRVIDSEARLPRDGSPWSSLDRQS